MYLLNYINKQKILFMFSVLLLIGNAYSTEDTQKYNTIDGYPVGECPKELIGSKCLASDNFNFKKFKFEDNTFFDISKIFGNNPGIYKDQHDQKICYRATIKDKNFLIEFGTWDHGYKNLSINSYEIKYDNEPHLSCGTVSLPLATLFPENSLRLGISKKEFLKIMAIKKSKSGNLIKVMGGIVTLDKQDYVNQSVTGHFDENGKLDSLIFDMKTEPF